MEKTKIEKFIKKYNLAGTIESVVWSNINDDLNVTAMTSDKKLFASVQLEGAAKGFINGVEVGVMRTERLRKQLACLSENINLALDIDEKDNTRVRQILSEDGKTEFNYVTSTIDTMDSVPKMKNIPLFEVEITLSPTFVETFLKAFSAISDDQTLFTLIMSKKTQKLQLVLGYKQNLSDRIVISVDAITGKDVVKTPISFSAKSLKEILSANGDVENPILKVSEAGLASISFDKDGFKSQYYIVKIDVED